MRTLTNPLKCMNRSEIFRLLEKYIMYPTARCSFWGNFSGHFARLACDHRYGYAHCLILMGLNRICDSLPDFIKYTPSSACSCNMRISRIDRAHEIAAIVFNFPFVVRMSHAAFHPSRHGSVEASTFPSVPFASFAPLRLCIESSPHFSPGRCVTRVSA
jgi:hypothetical protein